MKTQPPETLYFSPEYIDVFMQAVKNASKRTMISNKSIFKKNDMEVEIYDTRAFFLIEVGQQYQKLIQSRCPICNSLIYEENDKTCKGNL
jgi:hypothetical protein